MKKIIFIVTVMFAGFNGYSQDFVDNALLFSRTRPGGSARIQALGGAQTSLGGDYSSAFSNPAGLGMFNRSEFTITPAVTTNKSSASYLGNKTDKTKTVFNLPGLSLVYHHETGKETGFIGGAFSITMNRINDFNRDFRYSGANSENSLVDYFINAADGLNPQTMLWTGKNPGDEFFTLHGLAYNNYLISDVLTDGEYAYKSILSPLPEERDPVTGQVIHPAETRTVDQEEISNSTGAQTQWSIAYGANFNDKFFLGATLGMASIRYKVHQYFRESNYRYSLDDTFNPVDNFQTDEEYNIRGSGINLILGAIFRPVDFLQVGLSYATPTYYNMVDNYTARIDSRWNEYGNGNSNYPNQSQVFEKFDEPLISEYDIITPSRLSAGVTLISKLGFITLDVEQANYAGARYSSNIDDNFDSENQSIKSAYEKAYNFRTGVEYRHEAYRVRAGLSYMPDPYTFNEIDQSITSFSGGLGYRAKKYFVDLAAIFTNTDRSRSPYFVNGPDPIAYQKFTSANYMLTFGFTF